MTDHLRVGDVSPRVQYVSNGALTVLSYPFPVFAAEDIEVWLGAARLPPTAFTVSGAGRSDGGTVALAAAPVAGTVITLRRRIALRRVSDYQDDGIIRAKVLNDEFDYQTMAVQQVAEDVARAVKRAHTSAATADLTLPDPAAGRTIKWNAAGTGLENSAADPDAALADTIAAREDAARSRSIAAAAAETATARAAEAIAAAASAQALVGVAVDPDPALAANSDKRLPPQSAVRAYVGAAVSDANAAAAARADTVARGRALREITLTSGTSWTTPATIDTSTTFEITLIAAGGSGGGAYSSAPVSAGGGGSGAVLTVLLSGLSPSTSYPIAIGAPGPGGVGAGGNWNGSAGGNTSITLGAHTFTVTGGGGGAGATGSGAGAGGSGGSASYDVGAAQIVFYGVGMQGGAGNTGYGSGSNLQFIVSGPGANSIYGIGGTTRGLVSDGAGNGRHASGFGAGGGGGLSNASVAGAGGSGSQGAIIIKWVG